MDIEDDFTDGMNMEVVDPVDDAEIYDIEKAVVEIHGDDEKIGKLWILRMTLQMNEHGSY